MTWREQQQSQRGKADSSSRKGSRKVVISQDHGQDRQLEHLSGDLRDNERPTLVSEKSGRDFIEDRWEASVRVCFGL